MELLKYDTSWYQSAAGQSYFTGLQSLEDKSIFVYSYLKKIAKESFERDHILFKTALFLADAIYGSALPYGTFPDFVDPRKNPFIAYLSNASSCPDNMVLWGIYASLLHNKVDPLQKDVWIYRCFTSEIVTEELKEYGCEFGFHPVMLESTERFAIREELQLVQLKLAWFFAKE